MSEAGQPAVRYETTVCWSSSQLRVNPMKMGVSPNSCLVGGVFQMGTGGRDLFVAALTISGKLSDICP